jgi:hypothetical protein
MWRRQATVFQNVPDDNELSTCAKGLSDVFQRLSGSALSKHLDEKTQNRHVEDAVRWSGRDIHSRSADAPGKIGFRDAGRRERNNPWQLDDRGRKSWAGLACGDGNPARAATEVKQNRCPLEAVLLSKQFAVARVPAWRPRRKAPSSASDIFPKSCLPKGALARMEPASLSRLAQRSAQEHIGLKGIRKAPRVDCERRSTDQ